MIVVNVRVPALEKVYNFSLDENARVRDLMEEMTELISQKEKVPAVLSQEEMVLCSLEHGTLCSRDALLSQCGIADGSELILA